MAGAVRTGAHTIWDMHFVKGHGTENDFVVLPDVGGQLELTPDLVAAICDRRRGIGADGVLRVVHTAALTDAGSARIDADVQAAGANGQAAGAEWFMDYRNADGSPAEMCGNGIRVYGRYLVDAGLVFPGRLLVATRSGTKQLTIPASGDVSVDMDHPDVGGGARARIDGRSYEGLRVCTGNPHLACVLSEPIDDINFSQPPSIEEDACPKGANVELVRMVGDEQVEMRVYERGVGETRSCGTGAVAAAAAAARSVGRDIGQWRVNVPGGRLTVSLDGETSYLGGPAVLVAEGEVNVGGSLRPSTRPLDRR